MNAVQINPQLQPGMGAAIILRACPAGQAWSMSANKCAPVANTGGSYTGSTTSSKTVYYVAGGVVLLAAGGAAWWKWGRKKR